MFNIRYDTYRGGSLSKPTQQFKKEEKDWISQASKRAEEMSKDAYDGATKAAKSGDRNQLKRIVEFFGSGKKTTEEVAVGAEKIYAFLNNAGNTVTFVDARHAGMRSADGKVRFPPRRCEYGHVMLIPGDARTAHVGSGMRVHLGHAFFDLSTELWDRAATIYHEIAHKILAIGDVEGGYGWNECRQLAKQDPQLALNNADNWSYYASSFKQGSGLRTPKVGASSSAPKPVVFRL